MATNRRLERIRLFARQLPEAWEDRPWGDPATKVGKKIFVFFGTNDGPNLTVKLESSHPAAMGIPGARASRYGLGRSGWVTVPLAGPNTPPAEVLEDWIDESYRLVAPKRLVRELDTTDAHER